MTNVAKLGEAYEEIMLLSLQGKISREERNARIVALRDSPVAVGLSFEQRSAIANEAVNCAAEAMDEIHASSYRLPPWVQP